MPRQPRVLCQSTQFVEGMITANPGVLRSNESAGVPVEVLAPISEQTVVNTVGIITYKCDMDVTNTGASEPTVVAAMLALAVCPFVDPVSDDSFDAGAALGDVTIPLIGLDKQAASMDAMTTTAADRIFVVMNLRHGNYEMMQSQPHRRLARFRNGCRGF